MGAWDQFCSRLTRERGARNEAGLAIQVQDATRTSWLWRGLRARAALEYDTTSKNAAKCAFVSIVGVVQFVE